MPSTTDREVITNSGSPAQPGVLGAMVLSILVFSGQLKATVLFIWLPTDLTLVTAVIVALSAFRSRVKLGSASRFLWLPLTLWVIFAIPFFYTPLSAAVAKPVLLFTITLLTAVAPFYLLRTVPQRSAFLWCTLTVGILAAIIITFTGSTVEGFDSRFILEGTDTIGTARLAGSGSLVCMLFAVFPNRRLSHRILLALLGGGLLILALMTGSRGPVFATAFALAIVVVGSSSFKKYRVRVALTVLTIIALVTRVAYVQSSDGFDRIAQFITGDDNTSSQARSRLADIAWTDLLDNSAGIGWGNFTAFNGLFQYPHNLYLEVSLEGGWLAGTVLIVLLIISCVRYLRLSHDPTHNVMFALLIFAAINAYVSSDINGNRLLWVALFSSFAVIVNSRGTTMSRTPSTNINRNLRLKHRKISRPDG